MNFTPQELLGGLAVALGLLGYVFYIRGIIQGKVKPHAFTWFVWALLTAIAFIAQVVEGGGPGAWVTGVTALFSVVFMIVGFGADSRKYITKSDWIFFTVALLTIPVWYLTNNPLVGHHNNDYRRRSVCAYCTQGIFPPRNGKCVDVRSVRFKIRHRTVCIRKFYLDNRTLPGITCFSKLCICCDGLMAQVQ